MLGCCKRRLAKRMAFLVNHGVGDLQITGVEVKRPFQSHAEE